MHDIEKSAISLVLVPYKRPAPIALLALLVPDPLLKDCSICGGIFDPIGSAH